jgi:hypothetical protein
MIATRSELIDLVKDAFANVSRKGGVSWAESEVLDMYGTEAEQKAARAKDPDQHWTELLNREDFYPSGIGGFCFLDPIGFQYYLPAAICLALAKREDTVFDLNSLGFHLQSAVGSRPRNMELFSDEQLTAIAECLWFELAECEWGYQKGGPYLYLDDVEPELAKLSFEVTFSDLPEFWQSFLTPIS